MPRGAHLTILVDNTSADARLGQEWGLAAAIDLPDGERWLWDTGASPMFLDHARTLGIAPEAADGLALSHGHYDHTGGLAALLESGFDAPVVAHPAFDASRFSIHEPGGPARPIGNPDEMPRPLPHLLGVSDARELAPGLTFVTEIRRRPGRFSAVSGFYRDPGGREADTVPDDALLVVEAGDRTGVILGCCHAGLANSLDHLNERLGIERVDVVVGGLHLVHADAEEIAESAEALERFGVHRVYAGHCTGEAAIAALRDRLGDRVLPLGSGREIEIG
jgi:7,8-dihydropterin-6-yl-methyl-4-(beta-D-ribofuranosyl)aminobenzene 5'-phosphate synthase